MCLHVGHGDGDVHVRSGDDAGARLGLHWVRITSLVKLWLPYCLVQGSS